MYESLASRAGVCCGCEFRKTRDISVVQFAREARRIEEIGEARPDPSLGTTTQRLPIHFLPRQAAAMFFDSRVGS